MENKEYFRNKGWKIDSIKKSKPGFKATNPKNELDVVKIIEVDKSKLKSGTSIPQVKQGTYLKRDHKKWTRVPLQDNPNID